MLERDPDLLVELVLSGVKPTAAAPRAGYSPTSAHRVLKARGIERRRANSAEPMRARILELVELGISAPEIARRLGYAESGIYKLLHRAGVKLRKGL